MDYLFTPGNPYMRNLVPCSVQNFKKYSPVKIIFSSILDNIPTLSFPWRLFCDIPIAWEYLMSKMPTLISSHIHQPSPHHCKQPLPSTVCRADCHNPAIPRNVLANQTLYSYFLGIPFQGITVLGVPK